MPRSYYDAVVLGTDLAPLLCAAQLARRGLRVLVLGQGVPEASYELDGVELDRQSRPFVGLSSPAVSQALEELALKQVLRQRSWLPERPLQLLLPSQRIDVSPDSSTWSGELAREVPEVRRRAEDVSRTLAEVRAELDALCGQGLIWPPETFVEKQRFAMASAGQRFDRHGHGWTSWDQLPREHPLRLAFSLCLQFTAELPIGQHSQATRARLFGHLLAGLQRVEQRWPGMQRLLLARIRSWGGEVRSNDRAELIEPGLGGSHILRLARSDEEVGAGQLVHGAPVSELTQLLTGRGGVEPVFERAGEPRPRAYRYTAHFLLERSGVPEALASQALLLPDPASEERALWLEQRRVDETRSLITVSRLIDAHLIEAEPAQLKDMRKQALAALRTIIPFIDESLIWLDSPHDGLPPQSVNGERELRCSDPWTRGPATMQAVYEYPTRRALGVCGLPTRTALRTVFLCNRQVCPGLGFEGAFLTASSVSRILASRYKRQSWLRRGSWASANV